MSVAALAVPAWPFRIDDDPAVSREADALRKHFRGVERDVSASVALGKLREEVRSRLDRAWVDASVDSWDGYGGRLVSSTTYGNALAFLETLPMGTPVPEVVPEPDGEIAFDWDYGPWRILSVSVGPTGTLNYAALYGPTAKQHGTEQLRDRLPGAIAACLDRLLAAGNGAP